MGTQIISNSDLSTNIQDAVLHKDGSIFIDEVLGGCFNKGIVSNKLFSIKEPKSLVFEFKLNRAGFKFFRRNKIAFIQDGKFIYINKNNDVIVNGLKVDNLKGTPIKVTFDKNGKFYIVTENSVFMVAENNNTLSLFTIVSKKIKDIFLSSENEYIVVNTDGTIEIVGFNNIKKSILTNLNNVFVEQVSGIVGTDIIVFLDNKNQTHSPTKELNNLKSVVGIDCSFDNVWVSKTDDTILLMGKDKKIYHEENIVNIYKENNNVIKSCTDGNIYLNNKKIISNVSPYIITVSSDNYGCLDVYGNLLTNNSQVFDFKKNISNTEIINSTKDTFSTTKRLSSSIFFGIQYNELSQNVNTYINHNGESTAVIVENDNEALMSNLKGVIVDFENSEYFRITNINKGDKSIITNQKNKNFVSFNNNEIFKVVIGFSAFGKICRVFKVINGKEYEVKTNFLSLEEQGVELGRPAIYIQNAFMFELKSITITDELNISLLPEEIVYRDIDTSIIQTKVAESLNKHTKTLKELSNTLHNTIVKLKEIDDYYSSKIHDIEETIK